jgi:hypothetical protein
MDVFVNLAAIAGGLVLLFGMAHFWDRDRPLAISCIVTAALFFAAMQFLGPGAAGS